jgi:predicted NAD/FAD-binding protein
MSPSAQRIGVLGGGVAGIASAWMLQDDHRVTLLEKEPRLGGHVETVPVTVDGKTIYAELGPRFFFNPSYPYFLGLLRLLGVKTTWNDGLVSFTDRRKGRSFVVPPRSARHVASLVRSPRMVGHLMSLRRLIGQQAEVVGRRDFSVPFHRYLSDNGYPASFGPELAYPFLAACWGCSVGTLAEFPAYSLLKGMPPGDKAGFFAVDGGVSSYIEAFARELSGVDVRLGHGAARIERATDGTLVVHDARGERHVFDQIVVATASFHAADLLRGVAGVESLQRATGGFRHFETDIVVHGDPSYMPKHRADWGGNNLFVDGDVTFMTDWQGQRDGAAVFRTWLPAGARLPQPMYARRGFRHLVMSPENAVLQGRIAALQGAAGVWVAGMYAADVDNHESALLSAVVPARALAPRSRNLARFLAAVDAKSAAHGVDVLPASVPGAPEDARA